MKQRFRLIVFLSVMMGGLVLGQRLHAQNTDEQDRENLDQIEAELGKSAKKDVKSESIYESESPAVKSSKSAALKTKKSGDEMLPPGVPDNSAAAGDGTGAGNEDNSASDLKKVSDLDSLSQFSEISIIQRKYMPKTERFQVFGGLVALTNDPWFYGLGLSGRLGYHFTENWGIEANAFGLTSSDKQSVTDLKANNGISTDSIIKTKGYLGLDAVWYPIYGKLSLANRKIVHFDMYFAGGYGQSSISGTDKGTAPTLHLATGQLFAVTKSVGVRWDFSWNYFTATQYDKNSGLSSQGNFSNLLLSVGVSYLFPEATYR